MDQELRDLERLAQTGDLDAQERLLQLRLRLGLCIHGNPPLYAEDACPICTALEQQYTLADAAKQGGWFFSKENTQVLKNLIEAYAYNNQPRPFNTCQECGDLIIDGTYQSYFPDFYDISFGRPNDITGYGGMICLECERNLAENQDDPCSPERLGTGSWLIYDRTSSMFWNNSVGWVDRTCAQRFENRGEAGDEADALEGPSRPPDLRLQRGTNFPADNVTIVHITTLPNLPHNPDCNCQECSEETS